MTVTICEREYDTNKNGIIILVKKDSSFERLLNIKSEVEYTVSKHRYADYGLVKEACSKKKNARVIKWGIILCVDEVGEIHNIRVADVKVEEYTLKLKLGSLVCENVKMFIDYLCGDCIQVKEFCREYISQDNYLIDIKKLVMPYDQQVVEKIRKSILADCEENYKLAARKVYMFRPRALNEYAKLVAVEEYDREVGILSLNSRISIIKDQITNLTQKKYNGYKDCMDSYLGVFERNLDKIQDQNLRRMVENETIYAYIEVFLEQNFYNQMNERIRIKPDTNLYEIHMGKNWNNGINTIRSLYITPRLGINGAWENDNSEIRRVKFDYYTIGHLLESGMVVEMDGERRLQNYRSFKECINALYPIDELEADEKRFVQCYINYVKKNEYRIKEIPLLIPQFRYGGLEKNHIYRGDFLILNYRNRDNVKKLLIELSRNSLHDSKGEADAIRRNDFICKYDVQTIELRDRELDNMEEVFESRIVQGGYLL